MDRLLEVEGSDCAERGYLRLPHVFRCTAAWNHAAARVAAAEAAGFGDRFGDGDLSAFGRHLQGPAVNRQGRLSEELPLLDEDEVA